MACNAVTFFVWDGHEGGHRLSAEILCCRTPLREAAAQRSILRRNRAVSASQSARMRWATGLCRVKGMCEVVTRKPVQLLCPSAFNDPAAVHDGHLIR